MSDSPERISLCCGTIQLYVPKTLKHIQTARKLLDLLEEELGRGDQEVVGIHPTTIESYNELSGMVYDLNNNERSVADRIEPIPQPPILPENAPTPKGLVFIPKFSWDRAKEKSYRTISFYEHEDGRAMVSYSKCRFFTTKAYVESIPYPIPYGYEPFKSLDNNKRIALRFYREYLAQEARDIEVQSAITKDERTEKLLKVAEVNKARWNNESKSEMSPRTEELRDLVIKKKVGVGAEFGKP